MMRSALFGILFSLVAVQPAFADPRADAAAIVDLTVTTEVMESAMSGMAQLVAGNIQNEVVKNGGRMSDTGAEVITEMMLLHMTGALVEEMRGPMIEAYVANHSAEALAAYRDFLETDAGAEIVGNLAAMSNEGILIGERVGESVAMVAIESVLSDVEQGAWPEGTTKTVQNELTLLFSD